MTLMAREFKASFAFVERNFNLTKRYWGWEFAWLIYSIAGALAVSLIGRSEGSERRRFSAVDRPQLAMASDAAVMPPSQWKNPMPATYRMPMTIQLSTVTSPAYLVCGKPRSTFDVAGSGHRDVTTLPRV